LLGGRGSVEEVMFEEGRGGEASAEKARAEERVRDLSVEHRRKGRLGRETSTKGDIIISR
jgi:hypothetical protein